jgi:hypothetical protein
MTTHTLCTRQIFVVQIFDRIPLIAPCFQSSRLAWPDVSSSLQVSLTPTCRSLGSLSGAPLLLAGSWCGGIAPRRLTTSRSMR